MKIQPDEEAPLTGAASNNKSSSDKGVSSNVGDCTPAKCCGCCASILCCLWVILTLIGIIGGYSFVRVCSVPYTGIDWLLHKAGLVCKTGNIAPRLSECDAFNCQFGMGPPFTPANVTSAHCISCGAELWTPECTPNELLKDQKHYSSSRPFTYVTFPSRKGKEGQPTVNITAWWMPALEKDAPRILVQHGNNVNFNDNTVQLPAYMLRKLGYSVLLPNLRDHGSSGKSIPHAINWGYAYHLDVLGAWDYAVNDPDGVLGGKMPAKRVGIMGYSMGGFAVANAFGLEPEVPALWLDAAVLDIKQELHFSVRLIFSFLPPSILGYLSAVSVWFGSYFAGANIQLYMPSESLVPKADSKIAGRRPVAWMQSTLDNIVDPMFSEEFVKLINEYSDHYELREKRIVPYWCGDKFPFQPHCQMHTWQAQTYQEDLCKFWSYAFKEDGEHCTSKVTHWPQCQDAHCYKAPMNHKKKHQRTD